MLQSRSPVSLPQGTSHAQIRTAPFASTEDSPSRLQLFHNSLGLIRDKPKSVSDLWALETTPLRAPLKTRREAAGPCESHPCNLSSPPRPQQPGYPSPNQYPTRSD